MKKRIILLLCFLAALFVLGGWAMKEVRLLDDSKLIDLNKAIGLAKPGGSAGDSEEESDASSESSSDDDPEGENLSDHGSTDSVAKDIVVRIRGDQIFYKCGVVNMGGFTDTQLESRIRSDYVSGARVILVDDFAESHAYKNIRGILEKLKNDIGLTYKEDLDQGGE